MIAPGKLNGYLVAIKEELRKAEGKHPKFCDLLVNNMSNWDRLEHMQKVVNSEPPFYGENILLEEVAEAFNAYQQGDKKHALQELAQCGAVILRIMAKVDEEIQKENN